MRMDPRPGDKIESAIWITGTEPPELLKRFEDDFNLNARALEGQFVGIEVSPAVVEMKLPGGERVPQVPDHISGPNVRLLCLTADVHQRNVFSRNEAGFIGDLKHEDHMRLRRITRRAARPHMEGMPLDDKAVDAIINQLGPEAAMHSLRQDAREA